MLLPTCSFCFDCHALVQPEASASLKLETSRQQPSQHTCTPRVSSAAASAAGSGSTCPVQGSSAPGAPGLAVSQQGETRCEEGRAEGSGPTPHHARCFSGAGFASGDARTELAGSEAGTQKSVLLTPSPIVPLLTVSLPGWAGLEWPDFPDRRTGKGYPGQLPPDSERLGISTSGRSSGTRQ